MEEERKERITLQKLIEIKQEESRNQVELVKLPDNFYDGVKNYINDFLKSIELIKSENSIELLEKLSNLRNKLSIYISVYDSLLKIRIKKIINKVLIAIEHGNPEYIDKSNFTEEEKELFWNIYDIIYKFYTKLKSFTEIEDKREEGEKRTEKTEEKEVKKREEELREERKEEKIEKKEQIEYVNLPKFDGEVGIGRIIKSLGKFIWKDKNVYGPFEKEDVVILPKEVLDFLSDRGIIQKIFINDNN